MGHRAVVADVVLGPPVVVEPEQTLRQLAGRLRAASVGSAVVLDDDGRLSGIVTERDIVVSLADGADPDLVWAGDVMTTEPICAEPGDGADHARALMLAAGIRHLPVVDDGRVVGVVSLRDVAPADELW